MNRRTFLKSTAISLLPSTLLLKGKETLKPLQLRPLQWTTFSSKLPKHKELILIAAKYEDVSCYAIGTRHRENFTYIKKMFFIDNGKTKYKEIYQNNEIKYPCGGYQLEENRLRWVTIKDLLKHATNTSINQSNITMDITLLEQQKKYNEIFVGKIINANKQNMTIITKDFFDPKTKMYQNIHSCIKNSIIGWTGFPKLSKPAILMSFIPSVLL